MKIIKKLVFFTTSFSIGNFILLILLPSISCSSHQHFYKTTVNNIALINVEGNHDQVVSDIEVHGILLWASIGLLMPLGIITIRFSNIQNCKRWVRQLLLYLHAISQTLSVLIATAGAVLSVRNFENSFNNNHQRIGLALYAAIWVQALIGFRRPPRGRKGRRMWYIVHWGLGTTICMVGIFNIYTGLEAYHKITSRNTRIWTVIFTSQIFFMALFYLFQDKWDYIKRKGGIVVENDPIIPPSDEEIPAKQELNSVEPSRKSNSLGNYFAKSNALKKLFQLTS